MPLKQQMLMMAERYLEIKVPITIIHGVKDKLVSFENVAYAEQAFAHLVNDITIVPIENAGHFIIWENIHVITDELIKFLN